MATLLPNGKQQFIDANGNPLAGGTVAYFVPSTSVPKDTYQDAGATILNTNPITLDAAGECLVYGSGAYRQVVRDSAGNLIWDQVTSDTAVGGLSWGGTSTGTANAQVIAASGFSQQDGQQVSFLVGAGLTNTGAATIASGIGSPGIAVLNDTSSGPTSLTGGELVAGNVAQLSYDAARGAFHLIDAPIIFGTTAGTAAQGNDQRFVPSGAVIDFAGAAAPTGWLLCFGQAISRTTFAALFAAIGTAYGGGDGTTTFNIPDLRGRFAAGKDDMGGTAANRLTNSATGGVNGAALGNAGGEQAHVLGIPEIPAHTHIAVSNTAFSAAPGGTNSAAVNTTTGSNTSSTGGGGAHNTVPPALVVNKIIKM